jgi:transcription antitermination factor NusG
MRTQWYAVHTAANREQRVAEQFKQRSMECFLPTYESLRQWKDRRKTLNRPLFPGYLFVHIPLCERTRVVQVPGVAYLVGFNGRPAALAESDVESIRKALALRMQLEPHAYLTVGCRVRICNGPFEGAEAILVRQSKPFRIVLSLQLIQSSVALEVSSTDIELLAADPSS